MAKRLMFLGVLVAALVGATAVAAQSTDPPKIEYVGSQTCAGCHKAEHAGWAASLHPLMIRDPRATTEKIILADFAKFTEVITDTKLKYADKDVVYVIGQRYRQRYILADPRTRRLVLGAGQWNVAGQGPAASDHQWQNAAAGDDWLSACAGCHTTGLNLEAAKTYKVGDKQLPFVELGVGCEACHGPGGAHVQNPTRDTIPVNRVKALDAAICGQCHTRGTGTEADGTRHGYPVGYMPGQPLTDKNLVPAKPTKLETDPNWWLDGHAKRYRQQYLEWLNSGHAASLQTILKTANAPDTCLGCHSADYISAARVVAAGGRDIVTPTLKTAQWGITCQVCHTPHAAGRQVFEPLLRTESYELCTSCHNDTRRGAQPFVLAAQAQQPAQEMFEGTGAFDVANTPSLHFAAGRKGGPICTSCHMPGTAANADPGDVATHNWKIIMPGRAQSNQPNACSACHMNPASKALQFTPQAIQQFIDSRQSEIRDKLKALTKSLKDLKSARAEWDPKAARKTEQQVAFEKAFSNVSFVEADGSYGIHNYEYARAILAKAEEQLAFAVIPPTSTPTITPSPTPVPTPTPFVLPPTPTPVPPPSGGATWPVWGILAAGIIVVVVLLIVRSPRRD